MARPTTAEVCNAYKELLTYDLKNDTVPTYYWVLDTNNGVRRAIVLGVTDYGNIAIKLAAQTTNNIMQCWFDGDWTIPYDNRTGDCFDYQIDLEQVETDRYIWAALEELLTEYDRMPHCNFCWV